ncbi:hypothetical protein BCR36DRAFT_344469 [Piromyces finnis]|uniref:DNA-directed RNA polymerase II subunit RPB7 n=1 Tax=Piromyces finnis TaxID=1754191 RepID=A0A1Y1VL20_9FUNG|nr:hypothetical protein BCR36DRAFT_344469 [Piromyces finnis]|eukprot:ORX57796.1 hypothetical protein BCR36DRAFT_344469 [Piromyces finnis]
MFFLKNLTHTILLHPQYFGPNIQACLIRRLHDEVEGTCSGRFGFIISVIEITSISRGMLHPTSGFAEFKIEYKAIVFKPFKNEVVDGIVTSVNKMGFFVEVGPVTVFVSNHLIPEDMKFDPNSNPPSYISVGAENQQRIANNVNVRLKIVGTRVDATEIFAIGTIKEDYLGCI